MRPVIAFQACVPVATLDLAFIAHCAACSSIRTNSSSPNVMRTKTASSRKSSARSPARPRTSRASCCPGATCSMDSNTATDTTSCCTSSRTSSITRLDGRAHRGRTAKRMPTGTQSCRRSTNRCARGGRRHADTLIDPYGAEDPGGILRGLHRDLLRASAADGRSCTPRCMRRCAGSIGWTPPPGPAARCGLRLHAPQQHAAHDEQQQQRKDGSARAVEQQGGAAHQQGPSTVPNFPTML